jgi:hypothetical protein
MDTASCAGCKRRVEAEELRASDLGSLVAWDRDSDGRWWCTECQVRIGRTPLLASRARRAADPRFDELTRLYTQAEHRAHIDTLLFWTLLGFLVAALAAVVVLGIG